MVRLRCEGRLRRGSVGQVAMDFYTSEGHASAPGICPICVLSESEASGLPGASNLMTIDERLEALAQTVELMAHMQGQTEKTVASLAGKIEKVAEAHAETEKIVSRLGRYAMLIARDYEARLSALEGGDE